MNRIEWMESFLINWKDAIIAKREVLFPSGLMKIDGVLQGIDAALKYSNQPPNSQMHMDKEPCGYCEAAKKSEYFDGFSFCPNCGMALSQ